MSAAMKKRYFIILERHQQTPHSPQADLLGQDGPVAHDEASGKRHLLLATRRGGGCRAHEHPMKAGA